MAKPTQRLGYRRLADALKERGLVDPKAVDEALEFAHQGGALFGEVLVGTNQISDWDLCRLVCEVFQLPFVPLDRVHPDPAASEGIDPSFLVKHGLVPLCRHGGLLTVALPGIVPADVLGMLSAQSDLAVLPVVGTVSGNRRWLDEHLVPGPLSESPEGEWSNLFDEADAAVLRELEEKAEKPEV